MSLQKPDVVALPSTVFQSKSLLVISGKAWSTIILCSLLVSVVKVHCGEYEVGESEVASVRNPPSAS